MKKICSVLAVLVLLGTAVQAQDAADYPVSVTGDTTLVLKRQNSYLSPLDMPAADIGDRVSFAVGSAPERIQWAMNVFNARMAVNGRDRSQVRVGAYLNLVCDKDEQLSLIHI